MKFEWAKGPNFAQAAEALQINTSQILAAAAVEEVLLVIYTPDVNGKPPFYRAELAYDADRILVVKGAPVEMATPQALDDLFGEGGE